MISIAICDKDEGRANEISEWIKEFFNGKDFTPTIKVIHEVKSKIMLVPTKHGNERIYIRHLNYIDIESRSLCYHLSTGNLQAGHILRTSFEKAVCQYLKHENLLFLKPSLLINLSNVKILDPEKIEFKNGDLLYYPKKYYEQIKEKWTK